MTRLDLAKKIHALLEEARDAKLGPEVVGEEFLRIGFDALIITDRVDLIDQYLTNFMEKVHKLSEASGAVADFNDGTGGGKA